MGCGGEAVVKAEVVIVRSDLHLRTVGQEWWLHEACYLCFSDGE